MTRIQFKIWPEVLKSDSMQRDQELLREIKKNLAEVKELSKTGGDGMKALKLTVLESIEGQTDILMQLCKQFPEIEEPIRT